MQSHVAYQNLQLLNMERSKLMAIDRSCCKGIVVNGADCGQVGSRAVYGPYMAWLIASL